MHSSPASAKRAIPHHERPVQAGSGAVSVDSSEGTRPVKSEAIDIVVWW